MVGVFRVNSSNTSPLTHMGKDAILREGPLPAAIIECPAELIESGKDFIRDWEP